MLFMEEPSFIFSSGKVELKQEGEDFYVEGYISTSDLDLVNDIVTKNCLIDMAEQMRERTIKLDIEHESFIGKSKIEQEINKTIIPAAKIEDFLMDKKGLKVRAMLNRHIKRFEEVKNSIRDGFLDAFSIAFVPVKAEIAIKDGQEIRLLEKVNLLNVAFTGNPINTNASIDKVFMKSLDFLNEKDSLGKPPKRKVPESEYEDDEEEEDKTGKHPKKKKKNNSHLRDRTNKLQEVKDMEEDNKEAEKEEESSEEAESGEEEVEKKDEEKEEEKEEEKPEESAEVKSLGEEVASLKDEVADLKAKIKLPIKKSMPTTEDKSKNFVEEAAQKPLDLI